MKLTCHKINPGSTEIFEFQARNSESFRTSVPIPQECVHENSERWAGDIPKFIGFH